MTDSTQTQNAVTGTTPSGGGTITMHPMALTASGPVAIGGKTYTVEIQILATGTANPPEGSTPLIPPSGGQVTGNWTVTGTNSDGSAFNYTPSAGGVRADQIG